MPVIDLLPGEPVLVRVYSDHSPSVLYSISTPVHGQDDGWGGNLIVNFVDPRDGDLLAIGGEDTYIDFGDPTEQDQVSGKVIRIAPEAV